MRAAFITGTGPSEAIEVGELPAPVPGPTDVLVQVELVAANPVDTYIRSGKYHTLLPLPFIVGRDLVGTVLSTGPGTGFAPGQRVWCNSLGHDGRQGSFAQFAAVPADRLYRLPDGVDPAQVVAVAHPAATAYLGWFVHAQLRAGETVYVGGAAGNVGAAAVAIARQAGAYVIAGARRQDHDACRANGATVTVDFNDPQLRDALRAAVPGGIDVFWDASGHHDFDLVAEIMKADGRVLLTAAANARPPLPASALYTRDISLHGFVISRARSTDLSAAAALINTLVPQGVLTAQICAELPLSATAEVHRRLEAGEVKGRVVLRP
jgi:NADPH:quinone reductase-like Zn-dependent oxidoreductase